LSEDKQINVVVLGGQNPQILNVDFLKHNGIIPRNEPPFKSLLEQKKPFTKYISTPVLANLCFDTIEFIVEETRFQVVEKNLSEWTNTKVMDITQKYFDVLHYTPVKVVGFNLTTTLSFEGVDSIHSMFLPTGSKILDIIEAPEKDVSGNFVLKYPWADGTARSTLTLNPNTQPDNERRVSFNYEFGFTDWDSFKGHTQKLPDIAEYFDTVLHKILNGA